MTRLLSALVVAPALFMQTMTASPTVDPNATPQASPTSVPTDVPTVVPSPTIVPAGAVSGGTWVVCPFGTTVQLQEGSDTSGDEVYVTCG